MFGINDNDTKTNPVAPGDNALSPSPAPDLTISSAPQADTSSPFTDTGPAPTNIPPAKQDSSTSPSQSATSGEHEENLLKLKQQALQNLAPLVGHLDQTPEEKFKTTMMLIQASDNSELIQEAYEAAGKITDEKERAQALLDIVNEINYFTQQSAPGNGSTSNN